MAFNVIGGQSAAVSVQLVCGGSLLATGSGSAVVDGNLVKGDNCPVLTAWSASPLQATAPTGSIDVTATASDADADESLTFTWSATSGTFAAASSSGPPPATSTTKYVCTDAGPATLKVTVTDNHVPSTCSASQEIPVDCNSGTCGNGVIDPGEECEPPLPGFCDANCHVVTNGGYCGDGIVQAGEECDFQLLNGQPCSECDSTCHLRPGECGDGCVTGTEQCDPPNVNTCTTSVCCDATCTIRKFDINPACDACERATYTTGKAQFSCVQSLYSGATGFACQSFSTSQLRSECDTLRACIISQHCSGTNGYGADDPTPCFCGALGVNDCDAMGGSPTAPCYAQYQAALAGGPPGLVTDLFTNPASPIGVANNLIKCDVDATCPCGQ
jgi:hypothetical protein